MVIKSKENSAGAWAFLIGIILTILVGIFTRASTNPFIYIILIGLGVVMGYFVSEKDAQTFLVASVATLLASFAGIQGFATNVSLTGITFSGIGVGKMIVSVLNSLLFLLVPATIIAALKTLFSISNV